MSEHQRLQGGCQCGRNNYIIIIPQDRIREAQVLFNTEPAHQIPLATPLAAYLRVPLSWYHSTTQAFFPDETHSLIRRMYTHPSQEYSKRHFCGYCGTPLSYWSEKPHSEAEYINLTLGSLLAEDLRDLEDMGLIPDESKIEETQVASTSRQGRESLGVPWFDGLVEGTRLGNMRRIQEVGSSRDGSVRVEWEVVEYNGEGEDADMEDPGTSNETTPGKRKRGDSNVGGPSPSKE